MGRCNVLTWSLEVRRPGPVQKTPPMMECYSAMKKNEIMPFAATWMDLAIIILSEVSQTEKDKYHVVSVICEL